MAADEVPADGVADAKRPLKVQGGPGGFVAQGSLGEGFLQHVKDEVAAGLLHQREAGSIDGDA